MDIFHPLPTMNSVVASKPKALMSPACSIDAAMAIRRTSRPRSPRPDEETVVRLRAPVVVMATTLSVVCEPSVAVPRG